MRTRVALWIVVLSLHPGCIDDEAIGRTEATLIITQPVRMDLAEFDDPRILQIGESRLATRQLHTQTRLSLWLFDDEQVDFEHRTTIERDDYRVWFGHSSEPEEGRIVLHEKNGIVIGRIQHQGRLFELRADDRAELREVLPSELSACAVSPAPSSSSSTRVLRNRTILPGTRIINRNEEEFLSERLFASWSSIPTRR